jgi:hypothetical protein
VNNSKCKHFNNQHYRIRIHRPGTIKGIKSKVLVAVEYKEAVIEAINFEKN